MPQASRPRSPARRPIGWQAARTRHAHGANRRPRHRLQEHGKPTARDHPAAGFPYDVRCSTASSRRSSLPDIECSCRGSAATGRRDSAILGAANGRAGRARSGRHRLRGRSASSASRSRASMGNRAACIVSSSSQSASSVRSRSAATPCKTRRARRHDAGEPSGPVLVHAVFYTDKAPRRCKRIVTTSSVTYGRPGRRSGNTPTRLTHYTPSFDNPDFVEVVVHSYRHRLMNAPGDEATPRDERRLAEQPTSMSPQSCLRPGPRARRPALGESRGRPAAVRDLAARRIVEGARHDLPAHRPDAVSKALSSSSVEPVSGATNDPLAYLRGTQPLKSWSGERIVRILLEEPVVSVSRSLVIAGKDMGLCQ